MTTARFHFRGFFCFLFCFVAMLAAGWPGVARSAAAAPETLSLDGLNVAVWKPAGLSDDYPLIVFSHGFGGCSTQSTFLMDALAQDGYLVLAPDHEDAKCGGKERTAGPAGDGREGWHPGNFRERLAARRNGGGAGQRTAGGGRPDVSFRNADQWNDTTYRDRAADIEAVLDAALARDEIAGIPIDAARIGLVGHSLGGYTALGLAGAWPSWKDGRIRAVLALSPYSEPFLNPGAGLGRMNVPVMYQGGTRDVGITPGVKKPGGIYDASSAPKYFVEFDGTGHFGWTDIMQSHHGLMIDYGLAFLDRYLQGKDSGVLRQKQSGVTDLRIQE